jgi:hypothetical protein
MREKPNEAVKLSILLAVFMLSAVALSASSLALTYYGYTDRTLYEKNTLIITRPILTRISRPT